MLTAIVLFKLDLIYVLVRMILDISKNGIHISSDPCKHLLMGQNPVYLINGEVRRILGLSSKNLADCPHWEFAQQGNLRSC